MKSATRNLEDDHVQILRLIEVMGRIIGSDTPRIDHLETIVDIIRNFADGLHHAKEEELFFPYLSTRGFSLNQGPVAVMLHEHIQGREFVHGIAENIEAFKSGNEAALGDIYRNMSGYADLLHNHITKENNILFRMADRALSEDDHILLLQEFSGAESNHPEGSPADYIARINVLAQEYDVE